MNFKKSLENRIHGWLPSTPTLPRRQTNTIGLQNTKKPFNPLPPIVENKFQLNVGILIGFGIGLIAIGFAGALFTNITFSEAQRFLSPDNLPPNNIFRHLIDQMSFYLAVGVGGIFVAILGALSLRSQAFREAFAYKEKHFIGNFLFGFGSGLIVFAFRFLFLYLFAASYPFLNQGYMQLEFFAGFLVVGACLLILGTRSWRRNK
jgi:uncharacterized membrane protein